ncbi:isochorismatase family protein [bacterium]|nr:isochorismatase family protein [bacterium]
MGNLNDPYIGWRIPLPEPDLKAGATALLVIDMQYADAHMEHGMMAYRREVGQLAGLDYFADRLAHIIPNIQSLQAAFRQQGIEVVFCRIASATGNGRDRGGAHKDLRIFCPPGSKEAEILEELAPVGDEMVFDKTTGSVFNGTNIHFVLSNMGIKNLVMVGVMTSGCVESAARDAKDMGYGVIVVSDACASWDEDLHRNSLRCMGEVFAKIKCTADVLAALPQPVVAAEMTPV